MYIILLIGIILGGLAIGRNYDKHFYNPITLFNLIWLMSIILLVFGLNYGIDMPTEKAFLITIIGLISFNMASFIMTLNKRKTAFSFGRKSGYFDPRINVPLLKFFIVLTLVLSFMRYATVAMQLLRGETNFAIIREEFFESNIHFIDAFFIFPMRYALIVCLASCFIKKEILELGKKYYIAMFVIIALTFLSSGGRSILVNGLYVILCAVGIYSTNHHILFKTKLKILLITIAFISLVVFVTSNRSWSFMSLGYESVLERNLITFVSYFSGGIVYLGKVISSTSLECSTYGLITIHGFLYPLYIILGYMGLFDTPQFIIDYNQLSNEVVIIGNGIPFNAFMTAFGSFYADFGFSGVFIYSALFSIITISVYKQIYWDEGERNINMLGTSAYLIMIIILCGFSQRWMMASSEYALIFIYMKIMFAKSRIDIHMKRNI